MTSGIWHGANGRLVSKRDLVSQEEEASLLDYLKSGDTAALIGQFTVNASTAEPVEKRVNACFFRNRWTRLRHVASVAALGALNDIIQGSCNWYILGRSAICGEANNGVACVSWDGGWQSMKGSVAKAVLDSAAETFGSGNEDKTQVHIVQDVYTPGIMRDIILNVAMNTKNKHV